jgi:predicted metal-dependent hydrolase
VPEDLVLPPLASLAEAQRLVDVGMPFHAHEVLEATWKAAPEQERDLWQGLAQLAVGYTHLLRGNPAGATTLLQRAHRRLNSYLDAPPYGVDVDGLLAWTESVLASLQATGVTKADPPRLRG